MCDPGFQDELIFTVDDVNTVTYCYAGTSRFLKKKMIFIFSYILFI